jgi:Uma2 family endonuclease
MDDVLLEPWTVERFLTWEDEQEGKHEFDGTRIIPMTGGSRKHQRLVQRLVSLLEESLDLDRFDAVQEMRLQIGDRARYPDVSVVEGAIPDRQKTIHDAVVLFEVLSDDTAAIDRQAKRDEYAMLASLRCYVLLEQDSMVATVLTKTSAGWDESRVEGGMLDIPEIGITISMTELHHSRRR